MLVDEYLLECCFGLLLLLSLMMFAAVEIAEIVWLVPLVRMV